ncbi:class I adenylate-forming enzyme family protein [Streptomyces scabiei]|uniref:class I adenylate-forming enzyme family protein n=2 Tax=Streptomyces scabiei TaxID=1930 RepID=UPI000765CE0F|nr:MULTISPECIES: long-chain fatty acid--CoA ligase [Streptomyces]MBP5894429.1 AMP-binding protein [Streptomyces sp. LBUM 1481]MBP5924695.1 AMP-binding protein [Streptomyces sp. LBUM 1483]MDX2686163.1 long-chain fatty acid--CoA ligase [Streptomyces scabiei]MDX2751069.1 long-chain fatty acid--CoA ligase [Streptomyces scabiei]MDX2805252.1 long-chain fatty acid--CoA ligase [Streptomyces scabiei]
MLISRQERARICSDTALGAGNILGRLRAYERPLDEPVLRTDGTWRAPDGSHPEVLTLGQLYEAVETYAGWYASRGVRPRDPVAVHSFSAVEFAVNFLALTSLGAVPSFVNGNLAPETAREYVRRQGAVGAFTDEAHREVLPGGPADVAGPGFRVTAADIRPEHRASLPASYPYRHDASDPVLISHSSGTTGMPKGVPHTHRTLMYAQVHRLRFSTGADMERTLVGLPGAHNAMVATLLYCLLLRADIKLLSSQRGADVLDAVEEFRPTTVLAFAGTFGEMAAEDLTVRDLSSVQVWFNTGDAAHEAHIRALVEHGSHIEIRRDLRRVRVDGSVFVDGLGSSEAGYSVFHNRHTKDTSAYSRRVGRPISFAEAAVLAEDGTPLPAGQIGRLGLRSPTLTPGYWNDSLTWNRMRLGGYWLTGDLAHQDEEGNFYHLDRVPDAVRTRAGIVFSTRTEELLLAELPRLADCTVVGVAPDGVRADWDGDGEAEAYALLQLTGEEGEDGDEVWTGRVNAVLTAAGFPPVTRALRMRPEDVAKGATGKVLKRVMRDRLAAAPAAADTAEEQQA